MKSKFISSEFVYDGTQLRSLFGYLDHGVQGDSVVSWIGPCSVGFDHMVDGEDLLAGARISGARMVHFVIEKFHTPLFAAVALQRLFAAICLDILRAHIDDGGGGGSGSGDDDRCGGEECSGKLRREGDDLYFGEGKLSISIATVSPVSSLIHFAVNCTNEGTPVCTASLADIAMDPAEFARRAMEKLIAEVASIEEAIVKVRWVR